MSTNHKSSLTIDTNQRSSASLHNCPSCHCQRLEPGSPCHIRIQPQPVRSLKLSHHFDSRAYSPGPVKVCSGRIFCPIGSLLENHLLPHPDEPISPLVIRVPVAGGITAWMLNLQLRILSRGIFRGWVWLGRNL